MRAYATANSPQAEVLEVNQSPENGVKVLIDTQLNKHKTAFIFLFSFDHHYIVFKTRCL